MPSLKNTCLQTRAHYFYIFTAIVLLNIPSGVHRVIKLLLIKFSCMTSGRDALLIQHYNFYTYAVIYLLLISYAGWKLSSLIALPLFITGESRGMQ